MLKSLPILVQIFLCLIILIQFLVFIIFVHEKKSKQQSQKQLQKFCSIQLDGIENRLLTLDSSKEIFNELEIFLVKRFNPQFIAFALPEKEQVMHLSYYKEQIPSKTICTALLTKVLSTQAEKNYLVFENYGISISFSLADNGKGYLLLGNFLISNNQNNKEIKNISSYILPPLSRILSRAISTVNIRVEQNERKQLQYAFSRYVSPEFVQKLMDNPEMLNTGGSLQYLSVLFSDLRGFTTLSDTLNTKTLVKILNLYLNEMSEVILNLGGTIDKFEGDAILAFFGAPVSFADHAVRCCRAAFRMKKMEKIINDQLMNEKLIPAPLFTRIGVNSGEMIVGNIGSLKRLDYTIIGTNVNIASRIEEVNKKYNTSILISENTKNLIGDEFKLNLVDDVVLRGVKQSIKIYEIIDDNNPGY